MRRRIPLILAIVTALIFTNFTEIFAQEVVGSATPTAQKPRRTQEQLDSLRLLSAEKTASIYSGIVLDSATREPIQSAVVYLMGTANTLRDRLITRSVVTDKKGRFEILVSGDSKLEVSCLGYKLYTQRVAPPTGQSSMITYRNGLMHNERATVDLGTIRLAPDLYNADEAVVKARIQMFEQRGDTTRIFPKLMKTMEGDALIEVLKQIPGFKVEADGTIYENGRKIERTYVNNELLFGEDPRTAFQKLTAESALAIDTYEEVVDETEATLTNRDNGEKTRRVANVTTTHKIDRYTTMDLLTEIGIDHDKDLDGSRNIRHNLYGVIGSYAVGKQLQIQASHSNTAIHSMFYRVDKILSSVKSGNPQSTMVDISGSFEQADSIYNQEKNKKFGKKAARLTGSYAFNDNRNTNKSRATSVYFPSINFDSQVIENINETKNKFQSHNATVNYIRYKGLPFRVRIDPSLSKSETFEQIQNVTTTDGSLLSKLDQNSLTESNRFNLRAEGISNIKIKENKSTTESEPSRMLGFSMRTNFSYTTTEGNGERDYELTDQEGTNLTTLTIESDDPSVEASITGGFNFISSKTFEEKNKSGYNKTSSIGLNLNLFYEYSRSKNYVIAINQATGQIDEAYSGDYVQNNNVAGVILKFNKTWESGLSLDSFINFSNTKVKSDEKIPNNSYVSEDFNNLHYNLTVRYNLLYFGFTTRATIPYVNQLSNVLDSENPMSLSAGNPNLKSGRNYNFNLSLSNRSFTKTRKINLISDFSFTLSTDPIAMMRRYFKESTILPEYGGYEVTAGATLNTPMNVGNHIILSGKINTSYMLKSFNTSFGLSVSGSYSNPFASIDNELIRNENSNANVEVSIIGTPSRKIRVNLSNRTTFSWQENEKYRDRSRTNNAYVSLRLDFLNRLTFTPSFFNTYQKAYTTGQTLERNALNLSLGARMLKKRNGLLSVNVYNLFNDNSGYNLSSTDQYISESWNQQFARFYSISFQYKFNSLDHKK